MIIRILGEGQYDVSAAAMDCLNVLDAELETEIQAADSDAFAVTLGRLLDAVRELGVAVPAAALITSDLVLPPEGSGLAEVAALLGDEGLIPGVMHDAYAISS